MVSAAVQESSITFCVSSPRLYSHSWELRTFSNSTRTTPTNTNLSRQFDDHSCGQELSSARRCAISLLSTWKVPRTRLPLPNTYISCPANDRQFRRSSLGMGTEKQSVASSYPPLHTSTDIRVKTNNTSGSRGVPFRAQARLNRTWYSERNQPTSLVQPSSQRGSMIVCFPIALPLYFKHTTYTLASSCRSVAVKKLPGIAAPRESLTDVGFTDVVEVEPRGAPLVLLSGLPPWSAPALPWRVCPTRIRPSRPLLLS